MYIYSLGHFLTTKGALIDGDVTPPLPPLKWVKKGDKNSQNLIKIEVKKVSKNTILNVKSHIFTEIDTIDIKNSKKVTKNDHKLRCKNSVKFDYQKGDSGSAGLLEEKCVMIEAPNLVSKNDQKSSQTRKMTENDQKSTKSENAEK